MASRKTTKTTQKPHSAGLRRTRSTSRAQVDTARLEALIEEAIVDAYDEDEQRMGFFTMLEENLEVPFTTEILGIPVEVTAIEINASNAIVAVCEKGRHVQRISLTDLPLPKPPPTGAEWIAAYRLFATRGG